MLDRLMDQTSAECLLGQLGRYEGGLKSASRKIRRVCMFCGGARQDLLGAANHKKL
jgi:hypothetical protein